MASSQQQIVGQSSVLFKFEIPSYDDYGGVGRVYQAGKELIGSAIDKVNGTNNTGPTTPFAGLLGPSSKAPRLIPISSAPIDIKSDFAWTSSKADAARAEMPYVYLTEKVVDRSSRLQNLMYSTVSLLQSPLGIVTGAAIGAGAGASLARSVGGTGSVSQFAGKVVGGVAGAAATNFFSEKTLPGEIYNNNLRAFSGLYSTTPTNFVYKLPFVKTTGNISKSISQGWNDDSSSIGDSLENISSDIAGVGGSSSGEGIVNTVTNTIGFGGDLAKALDGINKVGSETNKNVFAAAYTESAKTFAYGSNVPSFTISFYLFNNLTWADTVKNWYAIFGLQYQNLPNRLNRLILTPSVIYEATVPGYFYSMYTFIKNLDVSFIGSNLMIDMPILQVNNSDDSVRQASTNQAATTNSTFKVIVPEVYKIDITFESLVPESQNLLYEALAQTRNNGSVPQTANAAAAAAPGGVGQFGSAGVGLTPGIRAGSLASTPGGF
jgi:hypothetical protein